MSKHKVVVHKVEHSKPGSTTAFSYLLNKSQMLVVLFIVYLVFALKSLFKPILHLHQTVVSSNWLQTGDLVVHYHKGYTSFNPINYLHTLLVHPQVSHVAVLWRNPQTNQLCVLDFGAPGNSLAVAWADGFDGPLGDVNVCTIEHHRQQYDGCMYILPLARRQNISIPRSTVVSFILRIEYAFRNPESVGTMEKVISYIQWRRTCFARQKKLVCTEFAAMFLDLLQLHPELSQCIDVHEILNLKKRSGERFFGSTVFRISA